LGSPEQTHHYDAAAWHCQWEICQVRVQFTAHFDKSAPAGFHDGMAQRLAVTKTWKLFINGAFPRSESGRSIAIESARGEVIGHVAHGSRKDLRDAVEAAFVAQPKWAGATAYNRGQVLYRMAEMLDGKREEFTEALRSNNPKSKIQNPKFEVDAAIDRLVCFAGWADKYAQVLGCNNAVAGPYYNFTIPEPTGVVGLVTPPEGSGPALLGLATLLAPPLCAGNAIVVIADEHAMIPAAIFGEVCATSDVPPGIINIITGKRAELLDHLARHRNVNAISAANLSREESTILKAGIAENLKRVHVAAIDDEEWFDPAVCENPWTIERFVEMKTIWHPSAT
jgi:acyl-CoA reductase-like NAD-dependent aldehyde dehydrogenase